MPLGAYRSPPDVRSDERGRATGSLATRSTTRRAVNPSLLHRRLLRRNPDTPSTECMRQRPQISQRIRSAIAALHGSYRMADLGPEASRTPVNMEKPLPRSQGRGASPMTPSVGAPNRPAP